jgi:hypothetical protein
MSQNQQVVSGDTPSQDVNAYGSPVVPPWLEHTLEQEPKPGTVDVRTGNKITMDPYPEDTVQIGVALPDRLFDDYPRCYR